MAEMTSNLTIKHPGVFSYLGDPLYFTGALIITVYLSLLYYVLLMRAVMTQAIHTQYGIPVPAAPFPWANVWESPNSRISALDGAGKPGVLIFSLAIFLVILTSALTGVYVTGVIYSRYRGFGAAGTACAAGGSILVMAGAGCPTCLVPIGAALGIVIPLVTLPLAGVEFLIVNALILIVLVAWFARRVRRGLSTTMAAAHTIKRSG
jgi:hypothetical protein